MTLVLPVILPIPRVVKYCWWKKSCTTWNVLETLSNNGINYLSLNWWVYRISSIKSMKDDFAVVYHTRPNRCPALIPPTEGLCALVSLVGSIVGLYGVGVVLAGPLLGGVQWRSKGRKVYSTSSNYDYKTEWSRYHVCDLQFRYCMSVSNCASMHVYEYIWIIYRTIQMIFDETQSPKGNKL